jgi:hypothetical protein
MGLLVGVFLALGIMLGMGGTSEACCGIGGLGSSGSRYDSSGYGTTDSYWGLGDSTSGPSFNSFSTDTRYNPSNYAGTTYDFGNGSRYHYDYYGNRSYQYPIYTPNSYDYGSSDGYDSGRDYDYSFGLGSSDDSDSSSWWWGWW